MPLRVIEIVAPRAEKDAVVKILEAQRPDEGFIRWEAPLEDGDSLSFRVIMEVQESEIILDKLESFFSLTQQYRVVVYSAEATIPRLTPLAEQEQQEETPALEEPENHKERISREELYADVLDTTTLSKSYVLLVVFSSIVAIIGLMRGNVAIIIGAMVLAPLLGPNVGLSLATTLGDAKLTRESLKTLVVGVVLCFGLSALAGVCLGLPDVTEELLSRSVTSYSDIILAIVSGAAGIVAFTQGVPTSLVGVMVALSLLPPLTASGLFLGAGMLPHAAGAGLLFLANIICLNLAGVLTFLFQGVQPLSWWDKERAKSATLRAALLWAALLVALVVLLALKK